MLRSEERTLFALEPECWFTPGVQCDVFALKIKKKKNNVTGQNDSILVHRIPTLGHFSIALTCNRLWADLLLEDELPEDQDVPVGVALIPSLRRCLAGRSRREHVLRNRETTVCRDLSGSRWTVAQPDVYAAPLGSVFSLPVFLLIVMDYGKEEQSPLRGSPTFDLRKFSSERLHLLAFSVQPYSLLRK